MKLKITLSLQLTKDKKVEEDEVEAHPQGDIYSTTERDYIQTPNELSAYHRPSSIDDDDSGAYQLKTGFQPTLPKAKNND